MKNYINLFDSCVYAFDSKNNILEEKDIGICADISSMLTPECSVAAMKCFQGCPYTNTAFDFDIRIDGEQIRANSWKWLPNAILRLGASNNFTVETVTAVVPASRSVVQKITITNLCDWEQTIPLDILYRGKTRLQEEWSFLIPKPGVDERENYSMSDDGRVLSSTSDGASYRLTVSLEGMRLFRRAYLWETDVTIGALASFSFYISAHMGSEEQTAREAEYTKDRYESQIERSFDYLQTEVDRIYNALPRLSSDSKALDNLYYRSLVTYILCRWENPDLCALPYFSTGSVNGGCMCSYLWDYCGGLMMHPIYDSEGNKKQLRAYLRNDLTKSYALNPVTSGAVGPWYQINQEKIICMVYHHIRATGEINFLFEQVGDRTVLEWMKYHAYVCDDVSRDVELYDYGEGGNNHLEIHGWDNGPYNGIMPDLNARRYMNYMRVYELTKLAGVPDERLPKRAEALKEKLKALWNEDEKWYDFIDMDGNRDIRYTVQMFKFLNSGVIDAHERDGLVSHLNDREFLSKFGLHSMSKLDTQYDQDDIDNGGGGGCTHFTMQVCAQLYEMGYDKIASDILPRVYWWGERMPYMGDSCAANLILNREQTPLQGDISSVSCAQMIFFSIFGISPSFDGSICICPVKHRPAENMKVDNVRLCGKNFSVDIRGDVFSVNIGTGVLSARIGESITISADE